MWLIILIIILVIVLIITLLSVIIVYHRRYWKFLQVPHESPKRISDLFRAITKHVGTTSVEIEQEQEHYRQLYLRFKSTGAPFCGFYHLLQPRVLVLDRELVKQILIKDFSNFNSRGIYYNERDDPLSADLWSLSGSTWKNMRIKLDPIFRKEQMRHLYSGIYAESEDFMENVALGLEYQDRGTLIDMKRLVKRYVLSSIASCVFGINTPSLKKKYPLDELEIATELIIHTRRHDIVLNAMLTRYNRLARKLHFSTTHGKVANYFINLIKDVVEEREKSNSLSQETTHDYLQSVIDIKRQELATHETDDNFDSKDLNEHLNNELAAHLIGFLKAGFEPTVNTLSHALYELALNKWVQDRIQLEVLDVLRNNNNEFTYNSIQEMKFMGQVISETVRMNPIAPFLVRYTLNDYRVPGQSMYLIRRGIYVIIPTYAMHNDPEYYPEPQLFDPERFSREQNRGREQCLWLGFGGGPRSCIGIQFSQLLMRVAIARLLQKYRLSLNATRIVHKHEPGIFLWVEPLISEPKKGNEESALI